MRLISTSSLLFLPMHDVPGRAGLVPTKTYEYLGSGRPILAAVPPGDARDLLTAAGTAAICSPTDAAGLADALREAVDGWRAGRVPPEPDWSVVSDLSGRCIGREMDALLEQTVTARPTVGG